PTKLIRSQRVGPIPAKHYRRLQPGAQVDLAEFIGHQPLGQQRHHHHGRQPRQTHKHKGRPVLQECSYTTTRTMKGKRNRGDTGIHAFPPWPRLRRRGSRMTYRASTIRLAITMLAATISKIACTTERSRLVTAVTNNRPSPGH